MISTNNHKYPKAEPIFIVGAPRSGTSLLRNILNRHPLIGLCDETYFFYYIYSRRRVFGNLEVLNNRRFLIDQYLSTHRIKKLRLDTDELANKLMKEGSRFDKLFLSLMQAYAEDHGKVRYGEKTPQHAFYVERLCEWFPDCKIIHLLRDPRDVVASLQRMPWARKSISANTKAWVNYTKSSAKVSTLENYLLVYYENLIQAPETELFRICEFIGESYSREMLMPDEAEIEQSTSSEWWFATAKQPVNNTLSGRWRKELSQVEAQVVEWIAGPLMRKYGYSIEFPQIEPGEKVKALIQEGFDYFQQKVSKPGRTWFYWFQPGKISKEEAWNDRF